MLLDLVCRCKGLKRRWRTGDRRASIVVLTGHDATTGVEALGAGRRIPRQGHVDGLLLPRAICYAIERAQAQPAQQLLEASGWRRMRLDAGCCEPLICDGVHWRRRIALAAARRPGRRLLRRGRTPTGRSSMIGDVSGYRPDGRLDEPAHQLAHADARLPSAGGVAGDARPRSHARTSSPSSSRPRYGAASQRTGGPLSPTTRRRGQAVGAGGPVPVRPNRLPPLGVRPTTDWQPTTVAAARRRTVAYTDGLIEGLRQRRGGSASMASSTSSLAAPGDQQRRAQVLAELVRGSSTAAS